jgi:peptidoglycan glycosyltransferase
MKRISRRMLFLIILIAILLAGAALFSVQYALYSGQWAVFPGNPHVYTGGNVSFGTVTDRDGTILLQNNDGRTYCDDSALRSAVMHLLGDRYGYISAPALAPYAHELAGHSLVNGLYSVGGTSGKAVLTISAQAQKAAQELLAGRKGTIGVYNYQTGEILCAVTSPTYDPDKMPDVEGDITGRYDGVYLNRFFQSTYVPGSIFKLITAAAALETVEGIENQTFYCGGTMDLDGDTVTCSGNHGNISFDQALAKSCNCAFAQIALAVGKDKLTFYAKNLGVTEPMKVDGITAAAGHFDIDAAADSEIAWAGIGQYTDLVNACRFMRIMGVIAGGGVGAEPYLVQEVRNTLTDRYEAETQLSPRLLRSDTAQTLAAMMHNNVQTVYGADQFPSGYVCAKSGTAEVGPGTTPHATFAGFLQDEEYPLAFIVIVENGGSGSAACAPIAGEILKVCIRAMEQE